MEDEIKELEPLEPVTTTFEIPGEIHRAFKTEAFRHGYTMKDAVAEAMADWTIKMKGE